MPASGLMFVTSKVLDPNKTSDAEYNRVYNEELLPEVLKHMKDCDFPQLGLRYRNTNQDSSRPNLALYPNPDSQWMLSPDQEEFLKRTRKSGILGGDVLDFVDFRFRLYEKIQTFEGYGHASKTGEDRGQTLVCVAIEPPEGEDAERDLDEWYRKQHLDMLSMCTGYRRGTRYRRIDGKKPRFLAMHEYACKPDELPNDQIEQVKATEWTKKIIGEAQIVERDVWELIEVQGDTSLKL